MAAGIDTRHSRACRSRNGGRCDCDPAYRARVRLKDRPPVVRHFASYAEAVSWRKDAVIALRRGRDIDQGGRKTLRRRSRRLAQGRRGRSDPVTRRIDLQAIGHPVL